MTTSESYQLIKTVCERSCTIKQDCPNESIEVRTRFRIGKGSLPFVFYLRELEDGTEIMVSSDNATLTGALVAMNGNKPESVWDLPDKEWSDLIEDFRKEYLAFPLQAGKPVPVAAEPCDDGMGQESISRGKNVSLGRAAVGGMMFGGAGAVVGLRFVALIFSFLPHKFNSFIVCRYISIFVAFIQLCMSLVDCGNFLRRRLANLAPLF